MSDRKNYYGCRIRPLEDQPVVSPRDPNEDRSWERFANCLGADPDLFFPERGDMEAIGLAKAVCRGCSVQASCFEANLHEKWGVWAATTELERKRIRKERAEQERSA